MVYKKEEGTYHHIEKLMKEKPRFLSPRGEACLLINSGINKEQSQEGFLTQALLASFLPTPS